MRPTIDSQLQNDLFRLLAKIHGTTKKGSHAYDCVAAMYDLLWSAEAIKEK